MTTWKLVPVEPTPEMAAVFIPESCKTGSWIDGYKAMLNAAPAPDVQPVAWIKKDRSSIEVSIMSSEYMVNLGFEPLYTHPPTADVQELVEALRWYQEQARLCRMIHSEGDAGREALADDGGNRAKSVLAKWEGK
jgi:hypothetical protein